MVSRRRAFRVNVKFYIFIIALAALAVGAVWFFMRSDTAQARLGSLNFELELPVVIVRNEEVITSENYEKVNFLVPDLQRVEADAPVAEVYKWGYNERVMNDLIDVRTRIEAYEEDSSAATQDLLSLNEQIDAQTDEIREIVRGGDGDVIAAERNLRSLMEQKRQLLDDSAQLDAQLEALQTQEQQLTDRVNSWREVSNAPSAGVVSYYYDGYESVINASNIRNVSAEEVGALLNGTLKVQAEETSARPLYRLVDNFSWYIVMDPGRQVLEFANDNTFSVTFSDYPGRTFEGRVVGNISEGNRYLYVMEFSEDIGSLVNTRRTMATFQSVFEGLIVPEQALTDSGGTTGVYVVENKVHTFVPVTVRIVEDGMAVVEPVDGSRLQNGSYVAV